MSNKKIAYQAKGKQWMKKRKVGTPELRKAIKEAVSKMAEKKAVIAHGQNIPLVTANGSIPNWIALAPVISQGTSQNQRVGNQVKVVKAMIRGHLTLLPVATTNAFGPPAFVKMWLLRYRLSNPASFASTDAASALFDTGAATSGCIANIFDIQAYINNDSYELVQEKVIKLSSASGTANIPSTTVGTIFDSGPASVPFSFEFGKKLGVCIYNDSTTSCTNKNLFLVFQAVYANGSSSGAGQLAEVSYAYRADYIDV